MRRRRFVAWASLFGVLIEYASLASARAQAQSWTLERAVRLAAARGETPRAVGELARAADARVDKARSLFLPDVTLTGSYTRRAFETTRNVGGETVVLQDHDALGATATLGLTLFDARAFPLYAQATTEREAANLRAVDASRVAGFDAALAFLGVLGTEQVAAAAERRVELARAGATEARARLEAGLASTNDVTRTELELAAAERDRARALGDAETARLDLGHLVGEPVVGALVAPDALLEDARRPPASLDRMARSAHARLDVVAAETSADALALAADEPLLRLVPSLGLEGQLRTTNETGFGGHDVDGSVGLKLTWVLYDGGERYADRDERVALASAGSLDAQGLARRAELEVRGAESGLRTGQAAVTQAEAAVRAAEQNSRETGALYKSGLATALAVTDASEELFRAEVDLARARFGLAQTLLTLRRAAGLDPFGKEVR